MKIIVSLSFQGQCREAFELYARVLGGEITTAVPYGEGPPGRPVDPRYRDWLMHSWLQVGDQAIIGADLLPEFAPNIGKPKNGFDVTYQTEDATKAREVFDALSEGGEVVMPFGPTFWSPGFGSLVDRFGVPWMVNLVPPPGWKPAS